MNKYNLIAYEIHGTEKTGYEVNDFQVVDTFDLDKKLHEMSHDEILNLVEAKECIEICGHSDFDYYVEFFNTDLNMHVAKLEKII